MDPYATSHFSNRALRVELKASDGSECEATAVMLSRIGEFDERKLFLEDGYPSMHAYCVGELKYTPEKASKRIYAARTARRFPGLFVAVADGRLHLSGLVMLAKYVTDGNVWDLVAAASRRTREEIAQLIADRFPRPDLPERLEAISPSSPMPSMGARDGLRYSPGNAETAMHLATPPASSPAPQHSPGNAASPMPARVTPLAPQRFGFQCTVDQETQDLWLYAKMLLSHEVPTGEMAAVLKGVLKLAVGQLEKRKFAATDRSGHSRGSADPRHIPAAVKHAVWERDGGRCTFASESGKRCEARRWLEFDHIEPVARGGASTAENLRLLCRAHNQHAAERAFGAEFMSDKRAKARARTEARRSRPGTRITPATGSALPAHCPRG
jgi:5-methylcytosine-specific restriction endonuclease McrA